MRSHDVTTLAFTILVMTMLPIPLFYTRQCSYVYLVHQHLIFFFFFNDPAPTGIYPLSLHDPLPILRPAAGSPELFFPPRKAPKSRKCCPGSWGLCGRAPSDLVACCESIQCSGPAPAAFRFRLSRSEEHTSELQSQSNLVCRLLLEKK